MAEALTVVLVGRPNVGKTALFNALTGERRWVGNWPGVTVDSVHGGFEHDGRCIEVIDLPGAYTLAGPRSLDEQVTARYLADRRVGVVVNVVDAAALERSLYLTAQVIESQGRLPSDGAAGSGVPVVVALSRIDRARAEGVDVDVERLADALGCPVVAVSAPAGEGIDRLKDAIIGALGAGPPPFPAYPADTVDMVAQRAAANGPAGAAARWAAIRAIEGEEGEVAHVDGLALGAARQAFVAAVARKVVKRRAPAGRSLTDRLDDVLLHPWWGLAAFLAAMYLMFLWTIHLGGAFVDAFDGVAGALLEHGVGSVLAAAGVPDWLVLAAQGAGKGARTVAAFIPIVASLYVFLAVLEESGYMARAAVVMDRFMRTIALPGKAFVPLVVGLGCNVPAVMATRTLEDEEDRKVTIAMTPFISCGARLPVYALFAATFFAESGQNLVFSLYLIGIGVAVLTGFVLKRAIFAGEAAPLLLELPSYHRPALSSVLSRTRDRVGAFLVDAGKVVVPVVMVLSLLNSFTPDGRVVREGGPDSLLAAAGRLATPAFAPIGIADDNWPATVGLFTGLFAKEAVVGTLRGLYAGDQGAAADAGVTALILEALATIPDNLGRLAEAALDPLGLAQAGLSPSDAAATADAGMAGALRAHFDGGAGAFAYLVFVLLYAPCVATIAAIRREAGGAWTVLTLFWATLMGYAFATLAYQAATFAQHPLSSAGWIAAVTAVSAVTVALMRRWAPRLAGSHAGAVCRGGCANCQIGHGEK